MGNLLSCRSTRRQLAGILGISAATIPLGAAFRPFRAPVASARPLGVGRGTDTRTYQVDDASGLRAALGSLPDPFLASEPGNPNVRFSDVAAQFAGVGVEFPAAIDDVDFVQWLGATSPLLLSPGLHDYMVYHGDAWRETFGFDYLQVRQIVVLNSGDHRVTVLRGMFDRPTVEAAWARSGYVPLGDGVVSLFPETPNDPPVIDFSNPTFNMGGVGEMNSAAMLGEDTIVFAEVADSVRAALGIAAGTSPSLADRPEVGVLLDAMHPALVSAALIGGVFGGGEGVPISNATLPPEMQRTEQEAEEALIAEVGPKPAGRLALLGITPGGPLLSLDNEGNRLPSTPVPGQPLATFELALLFDDPSAAAVAATIITRRLTFLHSDIYWGLFDRPPTYGELFQRTEVSTEADSPVVRLHLEPGGDVLPSVFRSLFEGGDLGFLA